MERLNTLLDRVEELKADKQEKDASSRLVTLARKAEVWRQINSLLKTLTT